LARLCSTTELFPQREWRLRPLPQHPLKSAKSLGFSDLVLLSYPKSYPWLNKLRRHSKAISREGQGTSGNKNRIFWSQKKKKSQREGYPGKIFFRKKIF